ncbi:photosystem II stability/assembly factor-like uncharacterized protein [Herbihabitans rhizosphaerae]|uniref:Photosystem II stability/assembly factor-like uncharacterized protein n=1 Tax=Herbihabitans rhizosphaerae TaxID=1872711 RepID=A0A4Q7KX87_9PSEU|nr:oxidoreductase [Herbihabitans rhizosphaerae]RZS40910.1 photosystem II stability/assembly factor-like uncharacterized protein [Herbihabitans rhizosphaerae]
MRIVRALALAVLATGLLAVPAAAENPPAAAGAVPLTWELKPTGSEARFRGLSAVSRKVAWASGSLGTVLRTTDGGATWNSVGPPDTATLQFRDIEAFDENTAVILSIGPGAESRVYRTTDGGATWSPGFVNDDPNAFYDCMSFFDRRNGIAMSDPVGGKFRILSTSDGGASWKVLPDNGMPPALPAEAGFAASGQCVTTHGRSDAWFATGGGAAARVFHSGDRGLTWTVTDTPLRSKASAGVFALAFRDSRHGIAIGGDFEAPTGGDALALTGTGGRTWKVPPQTPAGYRSGVTYHPFLPNVVIAVGPTGSEVSISGGRTWHAFDQGSFDTVDCTRDGSCWAAGEKGRVARLRLGG